MSLRTRRPSRICIVSTGHIGSNPRVVKEADALHAAGQAVSVIAPRVLDLVEPLDQAVVRGAPWRLLRIDLRPSLAGRARRVVQLSARQAYASLGLAGCAETGLSPSGRIISRAACASPADLYVAHYPAALPAAAAAARLHGARYAYDAEDFHPGDWPDAAAYQIDRRLVRAVESRYLPGCSYVTAASPGIADAYAEAYGMERPRVVLNAFPLAHAAPAPTARGSARPGPSLYWFSQIIGPERGIECAVRAIGLAATRPHLYLRGTAAAGFAARLQQLAGEAGAAGRVHLLPPEPPDKMEELAAAYDAGLCSETGHTAARRLCLTNKLFTFLLAGLPPLLSDTPAQSRFAAEAGLSDLVYAGGDPAALARLVDRLLGDAGRLAAARAEAWRLGQQRYNWEQEQPALLACIAACLREQPQGQQQGVPA